MTILVSNANGKVGHEVAKALLAAGQSVRIGARAVDKAKAEFPGAEIVELDFARPATLAAAVNGVGAVFSATPYELLPNAEQELIAAAKSAGVKRFVKLSAMGVEGDPYSPHMLAEKALEGIGPCLDGAAADLLHAELLDDDGALSARGRDLRGGGRRRDQLRRRSRYCGCRGRRADQAGPRRQNLHPDRPLGADPQRRRGGPDPGDRQEGHLRCDRRCGAARRDGWARRPRSRN